MIIDKITIIGFLLVLAIALAIVIRDGFTISKLKLDKQRQREMYEEELEKRDTKIARLEKRIGFYEHANLEVGEHE